MKKPVLRTEKHAHLESTIHYYQTYLLELCVKSCHTFGAMFYIGGSFGYFLSTSNCCNICM